MAQERRLADIAVDGNRVTAVGALTHLTRDRPSGLSSALIGLLKSRPARQSAFMGGMIGGPVQGMKANTNIIDNGNINSSRPTIFADLPVGGKRLLQTATGCQATIASGVAKFENRIATDALPGRLLRSAPNAFTAVLAAA